MAYNPATDFLALLRLVGSDVRSERMPALDLIVSALARIGMFALSVSQTAPTVNQATTVWLKPASPSWLAEGTFYLWNPVAGAYQVATPALWRAFLTPSGAVFQSLIAANNVIDPGVTLAAVQRDNGNAPTVTNVQLPLLASQYLTQRDLELVDFSTNIVNHTIVLSTVDGSTIMQRANWNLFSTADQLGGVRLRPSPDLNSWIIAP